MKLIFLVIKLVSLFTANQAFDEDIRHTAAKRNIMSGTHVRISAIAWEPILYITKGANGSYSYDGVSFLIFDLLSKTLNFTFDFTHTSDEEITKFGPVWAGINALKRNEVDILGSGMTTFNLRPSEMDWTAPITFPQYRFLLPMPEEESRLYTVLRPFHFWVWLLLLISIVFTVFSMNGLNNANKNMNNRDIKISELSDHTIYVLTILTSQGNWTRPIQHSFRLAVGTWCLATIILIYGYSTTMSAFLAVPKLKPLIGTMEELAADSHLKIFVEMNSLISIDLLQAKSGYKKVLGDTLRTHPGALSTIPANKLGQFMNGSFAYPGFEMFLYVMAAEAYKLSGRKCRYTLSKKTLPYFAPSVFGLQKNCPFREEIDSKFHLMWSSGLLELWFKNFRKSIARQKQLSLIDLSGAFVVLGLGIGLSGIVFLVEFIKRKATINCSRTELASQIQ